MVAGFILILEIQDRSMNGVEYRNDQYGFSLKYPLGWEAIPEKDLKFRNEKFVAGFYRPETPSTAVGVIVEERNPEARVEMQLFIERLSDGLKARLTDFRLISSWRGGRGKNQAVEIEYEYKHLDKAYVRQRQLIVITKDKIYYLSGSMLIQNIQNHLREMKYILKTFELK